SVQFVNPQTFCDSVWHLCDTAQELFGSFVGANTFVMTGFAPHWDEIDAFLLQLEGRKHWKVFAPIDDDDSLPRISSGSLSEMGGDLRFRRALTRTNYILLIKV
uniref:Bifunctional lysine-specific demethylase and histidyl-hydroxylase n=1 Tax=Parascaris equorum TaxID=6256 RepID=A0A914RBS2_PAREQ